MNTREQGIAGGNPGTLERRFQLVLLAAAISWLFFTALVFGAERSFHYEYILLVPFVLYLTLKSIAARDFPVHWFIGGFFVFSIYASLSGLWSVDPDRSLLTAQRILMIAIVLPGFWLFIRTPENFLVFVKLHCGVAALAAVVGTLFFTDMPNRQFNGFGPAVTGMLFFAAAVSGFAAYILDHRRLRYVFSIALCLVPIMLVGSVRGALAVICVALSIWFATLVPPWKKLSVGKVLVRVSIAVMVLGSIIAALYVVGDQLGARVSRNAEFVSAVAEGADPYALGGPAIRIVLYLEGLQVLKENFAWFGHGIHATYSIMADRLGIETYTHVDHLEVLIGLGAVGGALYFGVLLIPWLTAIRTSGLSKIHRGFVFGVGAGVLILSLTGRLYTSLSVWIAIAVTVAFPVTVLFFSGEGRASRALRVDPQPHQLSSSDEAES